MENGEWSFKIDLSVNYQYAAELSAETAPYDGYALNLLRSVGLRVEIPEAQWRVKP